MDTRSKVFFVLMALIVLVVIGYRYKEFVIDKNFTIYSITSCDPTTESCFINTDCAEGDVGCSTKPYKKIERIARNVPNCSTPDECFTMRCLPDESDCVITSCSPDALEDGEECSEPEIVIPDSDIQKTSTSTESQ